MRVKTTKTKEVKPTANDISFSQEEIIWLFRSWTFTDTCLREQTPNWTDSCSSSDQKIRKYCPWRKFVWIDRIPREKLWLQVFRIKHNYIDLGNFHPILFVLIQECILLCSPNWTGGGVHCLRTEAHSLYTLTSIFANSGTAWENCWILQKK